MESILTPDKQVAEEFRATAVTTSSGQKVIGLVVRESATELELLLPDTSRRVIKVADIEERKKAFTVLQKQVLEQALSVPLLFQFELDAHNNKVKGFKPNLLGKPRFDGVWLDS